MEISVDQYQDQIAEAQKNYERFIVCLDRTPDECDAAVRSLLQKAIDAYKSREPGLRHGIAVGPQMTVIISQTDCDTPLCGIYFNLFSPYRKKAAPAPPA
jgi:hypothetical protein